MLKNNSINSKGLVCEECLVNPACNIPCKILERQLFFFLNQSPKDTFYRLATDIRTKMVKVIINKNKHEIILIRGKSQTTLKF